MQYNLSNDEKTLIKEFKKMHIPSIFKLQYIDHMLFVEDVVFFVCDALLRNKNVCEDALNELKINYEKFISEVDINILDEYAKSFCNSCAKIVNILFNRLKGA